MRFGKAAVKREKRRRMSGKAVFTAKNAKIARNLGELRAVTRMAWVGGSIDRKPMIVAISQEPARQRFTWKCQNFLYMFKRICAEGAEERGEERVGSVLLDFLS
jgi:hypothetical protein